LAGIYLGGRLPIDFSSFLNSHLQPFSLPYETNQKQFFSHRRIRQQADGELPRSIGDSYLAIKKQIIYK
jgi:hypothetical protein